MLNLFVGYDPRESAIYHVFCQSVMEYASGPVKFIPLHRSMLENFDGQQDGTNAFIYSRYLVPELMDYDGWAIFCDGDMIVEDDIYNLYELRDETKAVQIVQHDYITLHPRKYVHTPLENDNIHYPRKNWSSVMLWNCGHRSNQILTREFVGSAGGEMLHRFQWLNDDEIGALPEEWNWLIGEYPYNPSAKLYHFTLGAPGFGAYHDCDGSKRWNAHLLNMLHMQGERQAEMVRRASWNNQKRVAL